MDIVDAHPDKDWNYGRKGLSINSSLMTDFIVKHKDGPLLGEAHQGYWDFRAISSNTFTLERKLYAANKIKHLYRKAMFIRHFNHWIKLKAVNSELNAELPYPQIGFPGGKDYRSAIEEWEQRSN